MHLVPLTLCSAGFQLIAIAARLLVWYPLQDMLANSHQLIILSCHLDRTGGPLAVSLYVTDRLVNCHRIADENRLQKAQLVITHRHRRFICIAAMCDCLC